MNTTELYELFVHHRKISTDSRNCPFGSLFFALKGENFDGNQFAAKALDAGAAYAIIDNPEYQINERTILVDNVLKTLQQLAHRHRKMLGIPIIGITGTNGKTTTKELIAAVLSTKYNTLYTEGNLNNQIGVPLTLLRLDNDHEMAVIEMGANHPGDIKELVEIVAPNYGIITNIGCAHLEGFGSLEGVIQTKGELYDYLRHTKGKIFIQHENKILQQIAKGLEQISYGQEEGDFTVGHVVSCNPFLTFMLLIRILSELTTWTISWQLSQWDDISRFLPNLSVGPSLPTNQPTTARNGKRRKRITSSLMPIMPIRAV